MPGLSARIQVGASLLALAAVLAACSADARTGARTSPRVAPPPVATTTPVQITRPDQIAAPASAAEAAAAVLRVERGLRGDDRSRETLQRLGWEQQKVYGTLAANEAWIAPVLAGLPDDVRAVTQANLDAGRGLQVLVEAQPGFPDWTIMSPLPADQLRAYYREGEAQFHIPWAYLAAIHFVETRMGRIHGNSSAGAQGPMQFIPSTWSAYGGGGDINDTHDAIIGAARYLAAAGGPANMDRALFAYNHSDSYVNAIKLYAQLMLADERAYDGYYQWQVYYRNTDGTHWLPEGWSLPR